MNPSQYIPGVCNIGEAEIAARRRVGWAGFGMRGVFNFGSEVNKTDSIMQAEFRAKDRKKAISIFIYSVIIGVIVTAVICLWA